MNLKLYSPFCFVHILVYIFSYPQCCWRMNPFNIWMHPVSYFNFQLCDSNSCAILLCKYSWDVACLTASKYLFSIVVYRNQVQVLNFEVVTFKTICHILISPFLWWAHSIHGSHLPISSLITSLWERLGWKRIGVPSSVEPQVLIHHSDCYTTVALERAIWESHKQRNFLICSWIEICSKPKFLFLRGLHHV